MKLKALKLNQLSRADLNNRQMNSLRGGCRICRCTCGQTGGSATLDVGHANANSGDAGYSSPGGGFQHCWRRCGDVWDFCNNGFN